MNIVLFQRLKPFQFEFQAQYALAEYQTDCQLEQKDFAQRETDIVKLQFQFRLYRMLF